MNVKDLIEHLKTLPQDYEVYFSGYTCGSSWHAPVRLEDFVEETHMESRKPIVQITADWN